VNEGLAQIRCLYNQSRLWSRLQTTLARITRIAPKWIHTVLKIFSPFTIFEFPRNFSLYWIYFSHSGFLTTCACPENRVSPEIFHCIEYLFYHSELWSNYVLALKNRVAQKFSTVLNILFTFRSFEQLALALKNRGCPEFTLLNIYSLLFFIFEQLSLALKNRVVWNLSLHWNTFNHSEFLSNLRLPWKTELPRNFLLYEICFSHSGFLSKSRLP